MKKPLAILLALGLMLSLSACGGPKEPVSNTDLVPYEEEPLIAETEGELADLESVLDRSIALPEEIDASRYTIIDDSVAQIEFSIGEASFVGRYAKGQQENLSGLEKDFTDTQTLDLDGVSVTIRYTDPEKTSSRRTFGVADAYDAENGVSLCIIQKDFTSVEDIQSAMEALMHSVAQGGADAAKDSADSGVSDTMEEEVCYI